jgi:RNA polymerase sigma factor (sigma-70 family)
MQALPNSVHDYDAHYWELLRSGDKEGLSHIFRTHYSLLYYYGLQLIPDEDFIRDALQDFFMDLWRMRENLSPNVALRPYLISSFRRKVLRQNKKNERQKREESKWTENYFQLLDQEQHPYLSVSDNRPQLKSALDSLSYQQKEVIFLRYYNSLGFKEIAEIMGLSYQSVRNYAHQAIRKMRDQLL